MNNDSQIKQIVDSAISNISKVAETNAVIGRPLVTMDGTTVLPISQLTFGFVAGGGEYGDKFSKISRTEIDNNFAGGSGGGATLTPIAFLVVGKNGVEIINTTQISNIEKVVDIAKDIVKGIVKN